MSVWGLEAGIAVVLFVVLLPLGILPLTYVHYRRYGTFAGWPAVITIATFLYVCGLVAFTFFPLPDANDQFCTLRDEISFWQWTPFASMGDVLDVARGSGIATAITSGVFLQVFFNVVLLVPLGFLLAYRFGKRFWPSIALGFGVSLLIELTQGTGVWRLYDCPYRLADVDDLITNTAGAGIGWALGYVLARFLPDPDPPSSPDLDPPKVRRRVFAGGLDVLALIIGGTIAQVAIILAVEAGLGSRDLESVGWLDPTLTVAAMIVTPLILFLVVPLARSDRGTPGQIAAWLGEIDPLGRPGRGAVLKRFGVRWLPIVVTAFLQPTLTLIAVIVVESIVVWRRPDRRSLSGVVSGTTTATTRWIERSLPEDDGAFRRQ